MTELEKAARQALAAMESFQNGTNGLFDGEFEEAITALRRALEQQPDDEPVAWRTFDGEGSYDYRTYDMNEDYAKDWNERNPKHKGWVEPLYTRPQPAAQSKWCDCEPSQCLGKAGCRWQAMNYSPLENPLAPDKQDSNRALAVCLLSEAAKSGHPAALGLAAQLAGVPPCEKCGYVTQHCRCPQPAAQWVGLTDDEIALVCAECAASAHRHNDISFARAIEAKLREKNGGKA